MQKIEFLAEIIKKGRERILILDGAEPQVIWLPIKKDTLEWYLQNNEILQEALLGLNSEVKTVNVKNIPLKWVQTLQWITKPKFSKIPIPQGLTVYTDAGKRSKAAAVTWQEGGQWKHKVISGTEEDSLQTLELAAVVWVFNSFMGPVNVVTDSLYVAGIVQRIEDSSVKSVQNKRLYTLMIQLRKSIKIRECVYSVIHIRSHKLDIGLGEGNARADRLVSFNEKAKGFDAARISHSVFHQNARGLRKQFQLTISDARSIVRACPICSDHNGGMGVGVGVNPRGLRANEIWQMDVTHVAEFGNLKYVHVTVDTHSHFIWATAQTGEKSIHVERHLLECFAVMGVPEQIKTDNAPAYVSQRIQTFLDTWNVEHVTGIPHSATGQAIIERTHFTLKQYLRKHRDVKDVKSRMSKVLFVLNYLCIFGNQEKPAIEIHQGLLSKERVQDTQAWVRYKDPKTGIWQNPAKVLYWGRGYVCVLSPTGPVWIPAKWIKPSLNVEPQSDGRTGERDPEETGHSCGLLEALF